MFSYFYGSANPSWSSRLSCQFFSNRCASLQVIISFQYLLDQFSVLRNGVCFIRPKLPLFSRHPTLFLQGFRFLNQVPILFMWSLFILFNQCSYPVVLMKMLYKFIILHSFSSPVDLIQALFIMSFPWFKCFLMPVHLLIIHFSLFFCSEVLKIPQKAHLVIQDPFNLFGGC